MSPYDRRELVQEFERALARIFHPLLERLANMSKQLDDLTAQVTANTNVIASAKALIVGLKSQLDAAIAAQANGDNGAALSALSANLKSSDDDLAAAVAANTPAAPATPPTA